MAKCIQCGQNAGMGMSYCTSCLVENARKQLNLEELSPTEENNSVLTPQKNLTSSSPRVLAVSSRYRDAYLVARAINGIGFVTKVVGIILSILIFLATWMLSMQFQNRSNDNGSIGASILVFFIGLLVAGYNGFVFYIIGILVSGYGQHLKAALDTAVNSSPFLTDEHRAQVMSLPLS